MLIKGYLIVIVVSLTIFTSVFLKADSKDLINAPTRIAIYYSSDQPISQESNHVKPFQNELKTALSLSQPNIAIEIIDLKNRIPFEVDQFLKDNPSFAITIGEKTLFRVLASRSNVPIFSLKTSKITLDRMRKIYQPLGVDLSGIYREQPYDRQLKLAQLIAPKKNNAYLLLGIMSRYQFYDYKEISLQNNFVFNYKILENQNSTVSYFKSLSPQNGMLFLLDNPQQYDENTIKLLLPTSYHLDVPMIGNRKVHGIYGALASIYSSNRALIQSMDSILQQFLEHGKLNSPDYLNNYSVMINQQVAQNFGLVKLNETVIQNQLSKAINL